MVYRKIEWGRTFKVKHEVSRKLMCGWDNTVGGGSSTSASTVHDSCTPFCIGQRHILSNGSIKPVKRCFFCQAWRRNPKHLLIVAQEPRIDSRLFHIGNASFVLVGRLNESKGILLCDNIHSAHATTQTQINMC